MLTGGGRAAPFGEFANALATAAMLVVLISILGPVSGAHMNPAVTLISALRRELSATLRAVHAQRAGRIKSRLLGAWPHP